MFTVNEVAAQMNVSRNQVVGWIDAGQLEAVDVGLGTKTRRLRISPEALGKYKQSKVVKPLPTRGKRIQVEQIV